MSTVSLSDVIYQGEGKWFPFLLVDENDDPIDISEASFIFKIKQSVDDVSPVFTATTFDISEAAVGKVKANLPASATINMAVGTYYAQLLTIITADTDVDKSDLVRFKIAKPVVTVVSPSVSPSISPSLSPSASASPSASPST